MHATLITLTHINETPSSQGLVFKTFIANTESSTATCACNTQLGLPNDEIEILSSGSYRSRDLNVGADI